MLFPLPPKYYRKAGGGIGMHKRSRSWAVVVFFSVFFLGGIVWGKIFEGVFEPQNLALFCFTFASLITVLFSLVLVPYYKRKAEKVQRILADEIASHDRKVVERALSSKTRKMREYK